MNSIATTFALKNGRAYPLAKAPDSIEEARANQRASNQVDAANLYLKEMRDVVDFVKSKDQYTQVDQDGIEVSRDENPAKGTVVLLDAPRDDSALYRSNRVSAALHGSDDAAAHLVFPNVKDVELQYEGRRENMHSFMKSEPTPEGGERIRYREGQRLTTFETHPNGTITMLEETLSSLDIVMGRGDF